MKEKIVNQVKLIVAEGNLKRTIEFLSKSIYETNDLPETDFRDVIQDFYFYKKKDILGDLTLREKVEEEYSIAIKIIKKLNKYINKPFFFEKIDENYISTLIRIIAEGHTEKTIEQLLSQDNLPLILKDRIVKISFEYFQIKSLINQDIIEQNEARRSLNKINSNLIKILESLKNIDHYRYYNENPLVFVVIAFDDQMEPIYETIKEVGVSFNLEPIRVKDVIGDYRITNKIIDLISKSKFVVADLSLEKPNVYFELGYARGLNKDIITICNQNTKIHFDVKDWTCLYYSDNQNLKINLQTRFETQIENGE